MGLAKTIGEEVLVVVFAGGGAGVGETGGEGG
jgi:hypothetical protein